MGEREGLIARMGTPDDRVETREAHIAHLERLVKRLQDPVHRESEPHATLIAELQAQIQGGAMGAALAEDARSGGI